MITVIIPTFRRPRLLARAIRSVLEQREQPLEVWVYDNASGDETAEVVAGFMADDPRVHYQANIADLGVHANINRAMAAATAPYFTVLSDDDLVLPGFFERAMAAFGQYREAMFVASPVILVDPNGRVLKLDGGGWPAGLYRPPQGLRTLVDRGHFIWTGILFRRELIDEVGVLDPATGSSSDLDFQLRAAGRHPFATVAEPGAIFYWHPASPSSHPALNHFWPTWPRIIDKVRTDEAVPVDVRDAVARRMEQRLRRLMLLVGLYATTRGRWDDAAGAADVLASHYGQRVAATAVRAAALAARSVAPLRAALGWLAFRIWWRGRRRLGPAQAEFDRQFRPLFEIPVVVAARKDSAA